MSAIYTQFRTMIIEPTLRDIGLWTPARELLLWGTVAHESIGFTAIKQLGTGPALGFFQMEPVTYNDIVENTIPGLSRKRPQTVIAMQSMVPRRYAGWAPARHLVNDAAYACAFAAVAYWRAPGAMPEAGDLPGLAAYWKRWYNTPQGAGTVEQWLTNYNKYCQ